ncbi:mechanosensitive ion channel, partial [Patescibacteria group bacterium]|nr:mechanosensitive ion channel [Patescibacteria group bacterium]
MADFINKIAKFLIPWFFSHGLKIIAILFVAYLIKKFASGFIEKIIRKVVVSNHFLSKEAEKKREDTLIRIVSGAISVVIWLIAGLMIFQELGIAIGPLLAAAGIAGLAFGFGGQYLIRDLISGLFIIFENQYRVGDVV